MYRQPQNHDHDDVPTMSTDPQLDDTAAKPPIMERGRSYNYPMSLKSTWEIYIRTVKSQDRSADNVKKQLLSLDCLLQQCSAEIEHTGSIPSFSDMKSVCNQLCKEFMSDILRITSTAKDEDGALLQKYFLEGRGWPLLQVIHKAGVQSVGGSRDLANLLVSLLPWCLKFPLKPQDVVQDEDNPPGAAFPPISQCFQSGTTTSHVKAPRQRHAANTSRQTYLSGEDGSGKFYDSGSAKRKVSHKRRASDNKEDTGSEDDSSDNKHDKSRGKSKRKPRLYHIYQSTDRPSHPKVDSESDDDHDISKLLGNMPKERTKTSGLELCVLVLDLLLDLSRSDIQQASPVKYLSPAILPHLLHCVANIDISMRIEDADVWHQKTKVMIQRHMLRVIFTACGIISAQQNGVNILIGHKVLEKLLSVGKKSNFSSLCCIPEDIENSECIDELGLLSEIVLGLLYCLNIVFEALPFSLTFIKSAVSLIEDFDTHNGFKLLRLNILFSDWVKCQSPDTVHIYDWLEDEPVKVFGSFLNTMKVVRVNYIHSVKCVKRKHQKCSYAEYFHHHHDILGVPMAQVIKNGMETENLQMKTRTVSQTSHSSTTSQISTHTPCLVATGTEFLLDMLTKVVSKATRLDILTSLYSAGMCCCIELQKVIRTFVISFEQLSPAVRSYALDTMNNILLEHFAGGMPAQQPDSHMISCAHCDTMAIRMKEQKDNHLTQVHNPLTRSFKCMEYGLDSGFSSSDAQREAKMMALHKLSKWAAIRDLKPLLYAKDEALAISLAKHLLVLAIKGNPYLKAELFFSLYMETLGYIGKPETSDYSSHGNQADSHRNFLSKSVQVHCLSALPYLLQANCVTKAFLTKKGVSKMCGLLEDNILRVPVLRVFEALIVLDEEKLNEGIQQTLDPTDLCPCPYKGGLVISSFLDQLSKRSFLDDSSSSDTEEHENVTESNQPKCRVRRDSVVLSKFSLPVLVDLWETCAKLCLHNRVFVAQFQDQQCLHRTKNLLLETLEVLTNSVDLGTITSQESTETEDSGLEWEQLSTFDTLTKMKSTGFSVRVALLESLLVVLGACYNYIGQEGNAKPNMWGKVKEIFRQCRGMEPSQYKMLFDAFLNAGMPHYVSVLEYSYKRNIALVYSRDDDIYDEEEVRGLLQAGSDEDGEFLSTEVGYDADTENTSTEGSEKDKHTKCCLLRSRIPEKVYFPSVFRLLFDLLITMKGQRSWRSVVNAVLHKLLQSVRADGSIVDALCEEDILGVILGEAGFWACLARREDDGATQDTLLALLPHLARARLTAHNLQDILRLFQHSDIPQENLLTMFLSIVENSEVKSYHSVTFPVKATERAQQELRDLMESGTFDTLTETVSPLLQSVSSLFYTATGRKPDVAGPPSAPVQTHVQEVWSTCALQTDLKDSLAWPPFQHGFTVAMWLSLCKRLTTNFCPMLPRYNLESDEGDMCEQHMASHKQQLPISKCLHLISVGTREKLLEVWADTDTNSLLFRITSSVSDMGLVVQEMELRGVMSPTTWQHLVLSYVEGLDGSTLTGKVTLVIDGCQTHSFILDHPYAAIRSRHKLSPHLCIGHAMDDPYCSQIGSWSLGSLMLFKGATIPKQLCFHLYTLGPNYESILKCDCTEETASYAPHLAKHTVLYSKIHYDFLVGLKRPDLTDLRNSLLLAYTAKQCTEMSVFTHAKVNTGQSPANYGFTLDGHMLTMQPRCVASVVQGQLTSRTNQNLEKAIQESGGMGAILFLVAKVYESCHDNMNTEEAERLQARGLQVLFSVLHHSSGMQNEFTNIGGHALLCKVLTSCRSVIGQRILKVLMDAVTTESLYRTPPGSSTLTLRHRSEAVIRDASIIEHLVLNWQVWESSDTSIMELLFAGLANLVRDDHPHQTFNIKQYQDINLLNKIFKIYQERIQEGYPALSVTVSQCAVSIVQNLMGSPPDDHLIMAICDFLLLVHPAANTYINHSRSGFYFSLSWALPPSPLTKWKQTQKWPPVLTSTPVKGSEDSTESVASQAKVNLTEAFKGYPMVDLATEVKPRSHSDPVGMAEVQRPNQAKLVVSPAKHNQAASPPGLHSVDGTKSIDQHTQEHNDQEQPPIDKTKAPTADELLVNFGTTDTPVVTDYETFYRKDEDSGTEESAYLSDCEMIEGPERSKEHLLLKFDDDDMELLKLEQGLTALCVGLLRLVCSVIVTMPDKMAEKTFEKSIINPRTLIVLAHSCSSEIREAIIKVLISYLERCNLYYLDDFLKMDGFQLLSAQLYQYPTHHEQLEGAVSILLQRPFNLDVGLQPEDSDSVGDVSKTQQAAIPLILSLLSNTTSDLALCHNSLQFCSQLFETFNVVATVMMEGGLVELLCNMILKLFDGGTRLTDVEDADENEILLKDILEFLKVIAVREFSASGPQHYQQFEDIVTLLKEMERREEETHGGESKGAATLRVFQQHVVMRVLDVVTKASEEVSQQPFSIFKSAPTMYDGASSQSHPASSNPTTGTTLHRASSLSQYPFSLTGSLAKMKLNKRSPVGYFVQSDHRYSDLSGQSGSGGDSDSSQDSLQMSIQSIQSVNLPIEKHIYSRRKAGDASRLVRGNSLLQSVLSIGKRKKLTTIPISQNELIERLKKVLTMAMDLTVFTERKAPESKKMVLLFEAAPPGVSIERAFQRKLFDFTYRAFESTLVQDKSIYRRTRNVIMWGAKDVLRVQLGRMLCFMLSTRQEFEQRVYSLACMMGEPRGRGEPRGVEVLKMIISTADVGNDLAYYLYKLMVDEKKHLLSQQVEDGAKFINILSSAGYAVLSPRKKLSLEALDMLSEREKLISSRHENQKLTWTKRKEAALSRIFHRYDSLASRLTETAMEVTQTVTQLQTQERNKFIMHIKQTMTDRIQVKKQWQEIVQNLTHERALWHDARSYPRSWQLNPTEGPCRVRKRLQRGHLGIEAKFLKETAQHKLEMEHADPPLIFLFEDDHQMSDSAALIYQLHKNKKIRYTSTCRAVSPNSESKGELLIGEDSVFFVADEAITDANYTQVLLGNKDQLSMTWPFEDIEEVHKRWYELMDRGLEIFLTSGKTCLLAFDSKQERDRLYQHLIMLELPNRIDTSNLLDILDKWLDGSMTNFEYLTHLNKIAGRSFNDLMQYPVVPFILRDYTSDMIDLRNPAVYRDLAKPVSVQEKKQEQKFVMTYNILKQEYEKRGSEGITGLRVAPYHFGSHYSNSGSVLHFLVRLSPFTKMFISFQDQSFDIPDRTFHNLHTSWRLSSVESNTDVKELIPEFFFCHEFFTNSEEFDFGVRQTGDEVCDVKLPPWCMSNPRLFTLIHRQALESDHVTETISSWIDLVFGYKQRGDEAVKAVNVFHPATYYGLDINSVKNSLDRKAIRTMVRTYGQTPKQLFMIAHPCKLQQDAKYDTSKLPPVQSISMSVKGLKWGRYLGSPACPAPEPVWEWVYPTQVATLVPLPTGYVFGVAAHSCLLVQYSQDKEKAVLTDTQIVWAAIILWGQTDGLIRIINDTNKPAVNFIQGNQYNEITCCVSVPDCRHLFVGDMSGIITIYNTKHNTAKESHLQMFGHRKCLYGHTGPITSLVVCKPYSIIVSASDDKTLIIWDLNRHAYVRSITSHSAGVKTLAISDTLGDIASVSHQGLGSELYLHTVNAEMVAMVTCEDTVTCLAYSGAPEGVSINVIAGGLSSGIIRMWNSWDLTPVRDLFHNNLLATPIVSLTFTQDSQRLYTSSADGRVMLWDYAGQSKPRQSKFKPFLYPS